MTVDPGHFHAALVQKEMYPGVAQRVDVYAPLGADLYEHLKRIDSFNRRTDRPTTWQTEIHASPDFFERMLREHPGNVVVLSGRNRGKIDRIVASVDAGLNVLADKPWILESEDLPKVEQALAEADKRGLVAYDIMTERFEVTTILQRALVNDRATFGELVKGTEAEPARLHGERPQPDEGRGRRPEHPTGLVLRHCRTRRGVQRHRHPPRRPGAVDPLSRSGDRLSRRRPCAGGAALAHLDSRVRLSTGDRRGALSAGADVLDQSSRRVVCPKGLMLRMIRGEYYCNTLVSYTVRGVHTKLNVIWDWEAPAGADTHFAFYRGTRARVEIRQTRADKYRPELYVIPTDPAIRAAVLSAVRARLDGLQHDYPGVGVEDRGARAPCRRSRMRSAWDTKPTSRR